MIIIYQHETEKKYKEYFLYGVRNLQARAMWGALEISLNTQLRIGTEGIT